MIDPYVYPGTKVLKNCFDIQDEDELEHIEADYFLLGFNNLVRSNFRIDSIFDVLLIHKTLFSGIFEWAGKPRTIDIYKSEPILGGSSIDYVFASYIETALAELDGEYKKYNFKTLNAKELVDKICYFISEFWHIHPFREGNSRTTSVFLYFLAKQNNLTINFETISKYGKYFRNALVLSSLYNNSCNEFLNGFVTDLCTRKNFNTQKYETIDGNEVSKYSYTHHTIKKLETIKKPEDWRK